MRIFSARKGAKHEEGSAPCLGSPTAGTISQNVALMAAAKGIGTGVVGGIDARSISETLHLSPSQEPLYVMPLGYPP